MMLDDVRETMGATLKSLGYSYNSKNPTELEAAYNKLLEIKPALAGFKTFGWEDQLIAGDVAICMTYSTLGNLLPEEHPHLTYIIPESGTSIWTDTLAIPAIALNLDAAYAWINFMLDPENALFAAEEMKINPPNQIAFNQLPAAIKSNTKRFPTPELISKSEGIAPVGEALQIYEKFWTQLKSA